MHTDVGSATQRPVLLRGAVRALESRTVFILGAVFFRAAIEVGYWAYVSPHHAYAGYAWRPDALKIVESWVIFALLILLAPKRLRRLSDAFVAILLFGLITPLLSFYGLANQNRAHLYIVLLGYVLVLIFRKGRPFRLHVLKQGPLLSRTLVLLGAAGVTAWFVITGAYSYFQLDLRQVYEFRRLVGQDINVGVMSYVNVWAYKVFGPTLLAIALWRRSCILAVAALTLHVFWFGVSAHKAVLFYPFVILGVWYWFRRMRGLSVLPLAMAGVVVASTLLYVGFDYGFPASLFVRRVFYTPAKVVFDYYEFFGAREFVWWSNSITSAFLDYPYHLNPARLIGEWLGTDAHVNASFLATGFMHAGAIGIILYGSIAGLLFRAIDSLANRGIPLWVALSVVIIPSRSLLLSADLPTALLTHGIGIGMIILFLLRSFRLQPEAGELPGRQTMDRGHA